MPTKKPIRRGIPVCFSLDVDAEALLRALQPNGKGIGCLLSELVRKEARERATRPALRRALAATAAADDE